MNPAQNSLRVVMGLKYSHTFLDVLPEMETNTLPWAGTGPGDLCLMNTIKQKRWSPVLEPRSLKGTLCSCGFLFGITHSEGSQMRCRANKCSDSYRARFMWQNLNFFWQNPTENRGPVLAVLSVSRLDSNPATPHKTLTEAWDLDHQLSASQLPDPGTLQWVSGFQRNVCHSIMRYYGFRFSMRKVKW